MPDTLELPPSSYSAPDRPPVIRTQDGGLIYLHIHDAEYMRQRADWRQKLAAAHPDRGGTANRFIKVERARAKWQLTEATWYARHGLLPPDNYAAPQLEQIRARNRRALLSRNPALSMEE